MWYTGRMAALSKKVSKDAPWSNGFFDDLFRGIWARVVSLLGVVNTRSLLEHARAEAAIQYPALDHLKIKDDGVYISPLAVLVEQGKENSEHLEEALWAFIDIFSKVVSELSGEMVSRQVLDAVQRRGKGKKFHESLTRGISSFKAI